MESENLSNPMVQWYANKLARIPNVMDEEEGEMECRTIGSEINEKWGLKGMIKICEFCRDKISRNLYDYIETVWDGIGGWQK